MEQSKPRKWELPDSEKPHAELLQKIESGIQRKSRFSPRAEEVLRAIDQRIELSGGNPRRQIINFGSIMALMICLVAFLMLHTGTHYWIVISWLATFLLLTLLSLRDINRYNRSISDQIEGSPVLAKLLLGEQELAQIYDWTPWPWSVAFLGYRPRDIGRWVVVLATNLDWYIDEPRSLLRWQWVGLVAYVALSLTMLPIDMLVKEFPAVVVYQGLVPFFLIAMFSNSCRAAVGLEVLRDYLRERFADDEDETQT